MNKHTSRLLLCALALSLALSTLGISVAAADQAKEPVTLDMYLIWAHPTLDGKWGTDPVSKAITDATGVHINIISPPEGVDANEKFTLMLASNDLPDLIMTDYTQLTKNMIDEGLVEDFESLATQYGCEDLLKFINKNEKLTFAPLRYKNGMRFQPDGLLYTVPNWLISEASWEYALNKGQDFGDYVAGWWLRDDIYKEIGEPEWKTENDVYESLKQVKETYKNAQGNPVTPVYFGLMNNNSQHWSYVLQNMSGAQNGLYLTPERQLQWFVKAPAVKDAMVWYNKLYREGLAETEAYTMLTEQYYEKQAQGSYFLLCGRDNWGAALNKRTSEAGHEEIKYVPQPVKAQWLGSGITQGFVSYTPTLGASGWLGVYITVDCADKEAAIKLQQFMWSEEGQLLQLYGVDGVATQWTDETHTKKKWVSDDIKTYYDTNFNDFSLETGVKKWWWWHDDGNSYKYGLYYEGNAMEETRAAQRQIARETPWYSVKQNFGLGNVTALVSAEGNTINTQLTQLLNTAMAKVYMAASEEECRAEFDKMLADMEGLGLSKLEAEWTSALAQLEELYGEPYRYVPFNEEMVHPLK